MAASAIMNGGAIGEVEDCPFITTFEHIEPKSASGTIASGTISPTTPSQKDVRLPTTVPECLPTFFHNSKQKVVQVDGHVREFITADIDVGRINKIHGWLWMCGRPLSARPLHRQAILGRKIVVSEQCDLHLLYHSNLLYVKPLPPYLLHKRVWRDYICPHKDLYASACGFLLSYIWLVRSQTDFRQAKAGDVPLLPDFVTWTEWKDFVSSFLSSIDADALDQVNERYHFGELRLGRINSIYRVAPQFIFSHFVRGYLYQYNRYAEFFQRNFGWIVIAFAFFSLLLSAMQVGVSVQPLQDNQTFRKASYGFVVFSTTLVAAILGFIMVLFISTFLFNMVAAIGHSQKAKLDRDKLANKRKDRHKEV